MKIAIFAVSLPEPNRKLGGVEVAVHRLANELANNPRDDVVVFSLGNCPAEARYQHQTLFNDFKWLKTKLGTWFVLPFLLNFIDFSDFDVIHLHGDDWFYVKRTIPSVRTLHGSALNEARTATSLKRKFVQSIIYPLEHVSAKLASLSLAIGTDTAHIYHLSHTIDNGVSLERFYPGAKTPEPSVLFVGTWQGRKRGEFVFNQFIQHVLPTFPNAKLWMVSDGCPDHPNVVDCKFPSDAELADLFRTAWVFAYPSTYEGFGIPYIEAMASGTAIVSSPNPGAEYVLDKGQYGVIAEDQRFGSLLLELLQDSDKRLLLAQKGIERAQIFSWKIVAEHHREMYQKVIEQSLRT